MTEVESCPFCGGKAYIQDGELYINHEDGCFISMYPLDYDEFGRMGINEINQIFINAWNRRANDG